MHQFNILNIYSEYREAKEYVHVFYTQPFKRTTVFQNLSKKGNFFPPYLRPDLENLKFFRFRIKVELLCVSNILESKHFLICYVILRRIQFETCSTYYL